MKLFARSILRWVSCLELLRPLMDLAPRGKVRSATDFARIGAQRLSTAVNDSIGRMEEVRAYESNFLADAAHELRTPLAALQAQLHVLVHAQTPQERAEAEEDMGHAIDRVTAMLKQLLAMARLESDASPLARDRLNLAELLQERVAAFGTAAIDKSIELDLDAPAACHVIVDRNALVLLIDNLVDNAVRYASIGGRVSVSLSTSDGAIDIKVADDGPGIPAAERERVFDRFHRLLGSDEQGCGLGLAIARRAAFLHGGVIELTEGIGGSGVAVEVRLPRPDFEGGGARSLARPVDESVS